MPIYSRDAEVFCGTLEQLDVWLRGVEWARNYDYLLRALTEPSEFLAVPATVNSFSILDMMLPFKVALQVLKNVVPYCSTYQYYSK